MKKESFIKKEKKKKPAEGYWSEFSNTHGDRNKYEGASAADFGATSTTLVKRVIH